MVVRGYKINGKVTAAVITIFGTAVLGSIGWLHQNVQDAAKKNTEQDGWIKGHEEWTDAVYPAVLSKIDDGLKAGNETREALSKSISERFKDKADRDTERAEWDTERWTEQRKANERIDTKLDKVLDRLPPKPQ